MSRRSAGWCGVIFFGHHGEQIAEFVEVETGKRSDRPQLAAAMSLAKAQTTCWWRSSTA